MNLLARKSVLFKYVFCSFITVAMFGGNFLSNLNNQNFDNGDIVSDTVEEISAPEQTELEIADTYKSNNAVKNKTIYFGQPVREVAFKSGDTYCTQTDAGTGIVNCSDTNFYFAHRAYAFGQLANANIGDTIVVDGIAFHVQAKFQRAVSSSDMNEIVASRYNGQQYGASFMTCAGPNDSERLVIFAN